MVVSYSGIRAHTLKVTVHSARELADKDWFGRSEPYVKVILGQSDFVTCSKKGTNPTWEQTFTFPYNDESSIRFQAWDKDLLYDDYIGIADYPLEQIIQSKNRSNRFEVPLTMKKGKSAGYLMVSLDFYPKSEQQGQKTQFMQQGYMPYSQQQPSTPTIPPYIPPIMNMPTAGSPQPMGYNAPPQSGYYPPPQYSQMHQQPTYNPMVMQQPSYNPMTMQPPAYNPVNMQQPAYNPATMQQPLYNPANMQQPSYNPVNMQQPSYNPVNMQQPAPNQYQMPQGGYTTMGAHVGRPSQQILPGGYSQPMGYGTQYPPGQNFQGNPYQQVQYPPMLPNRGFHPSG